MKIGYLGPKSTFTYQATKFCFDGQNQELVAFSSIPNCLNALKKNKVDYVVVPIENSLEGSVHASVDGLFEEQDIRVIREIILPIEQQLLVTHNNQSIEKIISHPQALAQSQRFLEMNYSDTFLEPVSSTTYAAEYVANHPDEPIAAIASKDAAKTYGLKILSSSIQDNRFNQTRFWLLGKEQLKLNDDLINVKCTLFLTLPKNGPGILNKVLSALAWREIDLCKIESRPLKTELGEYYFILDISMNQDQQLIEYALDEIRLLGVNVQHLGYYPIIVKER